MTDTSSTEDLQTPPVQAAEGSRSSNLALTTFAQAPSGTVSRMFSSLARLAVEVAFLCWPAVVLNRGPLVFPDTSTYFQGGQAISDRVTAMIRHNESLANAATQGARAARSVFYSAFTYYPTVIWSTWLVILLQAMFVACSLGLLLRLSIPHYGRWRITLLITLLALGTTVSWCASLMLPDVFTGVMITCLIIVVVFWHSLRVRGRLIVLLALGFSTLMHLSNIPLALSVLFCTALARLRSWRSHWPMLASVAGIVAGVISMVLVSSVIGFEQWSLAPNAPPYLLARSIEDGPGRLYLLAHCPQLGLAMCNHLDRLELNADDFLWHRNGVYAVVSRAEAARLRAEGNSMFVAAALEHPWMQTRAYLRSAGYQLGLFTLGEFRVPSRAMLNNGQMTLYPWVPDAVDEKPPDRAPWKGPLNVWEYFVVALSLVACGALWVRGELDRKQRAILLLVVAAVLINALVVAASMPAPRYGARVIWLVPMAALIAVCGRNPAAAIGATDLRERI